MSIIYVDYNLLTIVAFVRNPIVIYTSVSGILEPKIDNAEVGMKLAVTGMMICYC